jgi:L-2,4-diaminobutyrate decarboxylase
MPGMDSASYGSTARAAVDVVTDYLADVIAGEEPVVVVEPPEAVAASLDLRRLIAEGGIDFPSWLRTYLDNGVRVHHPAQMAHQLASPNVGAAMADLVHGAVNQPMSLYEMGAAAATVERIVVEWMLGKVGFDAGEGAGVLTHGGSVANLTVMLAARAAAAPDAWKHGVPGDLAILAAPSAHYSIARSAAMMGLGEDAVVALEVDALERIVPDRLGPALERCRAAGRRPIALVAGACFTSTGLHDDLRAIGAVCRSEGIWFHVDGAHGASALLSDSLRGRLDGIELADSVIWDAHKMLRTSALCAAVLMRRGSALPAAFQQHATYLDVANASGLNTLDRQIECTKAELGLKIFLSLAWQGEQAIAAYVEAQYEKALALWEMARARPGFSLPYRPEANILCFRYGDGDQMAIRDTLAAAGTFHLSTVELAGELHLRAAIMSQATSPATFTALLDAIEAVAERSGSAPEPGYTSAPTLRL